MGKAGKANKRKRMAKMQKQSRKQNRQHKSCAVKPIAEAEALTEIVEPADVVDTSVESIAPVAPAAPAETPVETVMPEEPDEIASMLEQIEQQLASLNPFDEQSEEESDEAAVLPVKAPREVVLCPASWNVLSESPECLYDKEMRLLVAPPRRAVHTLRTHKQLLWYAAAMALSLTALITSVGAWFADSLQARLSTMELQSMYVGWDLDDGVGTGHSDTIVLPCATKINDTTAALFNGEAAVLKTYTIDMGEAPDTQVKISVSGQTNGLLAYVCDAETVSNAYNEVRTKLSNAGTNWTYSDMKTKLATINNRAVGTRTGDEIKVTVLYWVEYDQRSASGKLNPTGAANSYWNSETATADQYRITLQFSRAEGGGS
ncbi:MAG: hypothetical protein IJU16_00395 [Clostridia bacterium]|nr:hypothetical protein [Clostridia bacterium]